MNDDPYDQATLSHINIADGIEPALIELAFIAEAFLATATLTRDPNPIPPATPTQKLPF